MHHRTSRAVAALFATLLLALAPAVLADGDEGGNDHEAGAMDAHGTTEASAAMTVSLDVRPDPKSGYNVHVVTTGFEWAPELASTDHVTGKGHAHLYVNGEKVARLYGPWFHLGALPEGENELRVTLNSNDHNDYVYRDEVVADAVTVAVGSMAAMTDEHEHDDHQHDGMAEEDHDDHDHDDHEHDEHDEHGAVTSANVVPVGEMGLRIEPMLASDGRFMLALTALHDGVLHGAPLSGTLTTPAGQRIGFGGDEAVTVIDSGRFRTGVYRLEGELAGEAFATAVSAYRGETELGTEVVAFLAPRPSLAAGATSEIFAYAFADGENVHKRYAVTRRMTGMQHLTDDEEIELVHTHFDHAPVAGFEPAGNQASVSFSMGGAWQLQVLLGSGLPETVAFDVTVTE